MEIHSLYHSNPRSLNALHYKKKKKPTKLEEWRPKRQDKKSEDSMMKSFPTKFIVFLTY